MKNLFAIIRDNSIILKNYFALTFIQILNAAYFIVMLPLLLPVIGVDTYGYFIYVTAVLSLASVIINFGFDMPGIRRAALGSINGITISEYFSSVLVFKVSASIVLLVSLLFLLDFFDVEKIEIYLYCYLGVISNVFIFSWLFQGRQKLIVVAAVHAALKIVSLVFIILFIKEKEDFDLFVLIVNLSNLIAGIALFFLALRLIEGDIGFCFTSFKKSVGEAVPFFGVAAIGILKYRSMEVFIGAFFGMRDVAVFDLANKIYSIPSMLATSINTAIFPKFAGVPGFNVKNIFLFEIFVAVFFLLCIVLFGYVAVDFLGAGALPEAYYVLILIGLNIFAFLIVGCYGYFKFLPAGRSDILLKNQIYALLFYLITLFIFYFIFSNIYMVVIALALSGFFEIFFCVVKSKDINKVEER